MKITSSLLLATLSIMTLTFFAGCREIMSEMSEDTLDYFLLNKHSFIFLWISAAAFIMLCVVNRGLVKKNGN